jgi:uncharacterized membrane protein
MTTPVTLALLAMILIGTGDAINKRARQLDIPIGSYLIIQTIFYTSTVLLLVLVSGNIRLQPADLVYALFGAVSGFAGFTLMLSSLTHGHASINYAIFRSSFVFSTAAALLLLNERLLLTKVIGIALACSAIVLFFYQPKRNNAKHKSLITALAAMLAAASFQIIMKLSTHVFSSPLSFLLLMSIFFGGFVLFYNMISGSFRFPAKTFLLAPINGIFMAVATFFYVTALQRGELSTVVPIIQLSFVVTAILSALFLHENIGALKVFGIICAAIAITILGMF